MDLTRLAALTPNFSWSAYFRQAGVTPAAVNVAQPEVLRGRQQGDAGDADRPVEDVPALDCRSTRRRRASRRPSSTPTSTSTARRSRARPRTRPRWKRCVVATDAALGQALGKSYVRDYFPPEAKAAADTMVRNLIDGASRRPDDASLDGRGHAAEGDRQARDLPAQDRLPRRLARLLVAHDRPRAVRPERRSAPASTSSTACSPRSAGRSTARTGR